MSNGPQWVDSKSRYVSGEEYILNGTKLGSWHWDGVTPGKGSEVKRHVIVSNLPSWRPRETAYATQEEARSALERFVRGWFTRCGAQVSW